MTDSLPDQPEKSNSPSHVACHVRKGKSGEAFWSRLGCAWPHADNEGFTIQLDAVPIDGRITLRPILEKSK